MTSPWSPDGKHLSYLDGGELVDLDRRLRCKPHVDDKSLQDHLHSKAQPSSSEQDRDHRIRYGWSAAYQWAPDSRHLRLRLADAAASGCTTCTTAPALEIASTGQASGDDPKFSPNGENISFIRNHSLAVVRLKDPGAPPTHSRPPRRTKPSSTAKSIGSTKEDTRRPQQLLLVPRFKEHRISSNERERCAGLPAHRLDSDPCKRRFAALPAAW